MDKEAGEIGRRDGERGGKYQEEELSPVFVSMGHLV